MAEKKKNGGSSTKYKELSIIAIILIYIIGLAAVGVGAYAITENSVLENRISKYAKKYANIVETSDKNIYFIDASMNDSVCNNINGSVTCKKNVSDSTIIKGYSLYIVEKYNLVDDKKTDIESNITVNGNIITAEAGYEFDTIESKVFGNNTDIIISLSNESGDKYSIVVDSNGKVLFK